MKNEQCTIQSEGQKNNYRYMKREKQLYSQVMCVNCMTDKRLGLVFVNIIVTCNDSRWIYASDVLVVLCGAHFYFLNY